jgi:uncharacterized protein (TIGR03437 family)
MRICLWASLAFALASSTLASQNLITSFAGTDWVYPQGSRPALASPLSAMATVAIAPNGDLLIADTYNAVVVRVTSAGVATVVAGNGIPGYSGDGGLATQSSLMGPQSVAADSAGNIYLSETNIYSGAGSSGSFTPRCAVRRVSPQGIITMIAGGGKCGDSTSTAPAVLESAGALATDSAGNLYVVSGKRVWKFAPGGAVTKVADETPVCTDSSDFHCGTSGQIAALAFGPGGNLYLSIADVPGYPSHIDLVTPAGTLSTFVPSFKPGFAMGPIAFDASGNLYYCYALYNPADASTLFSVREQGVSGAIAGSAAAYSGDGGPASAAGFQHPTGLAVDASGTVYVSDAGRIRAFLPGGNIRVVAGNGAYHSSGDGGPAKSATFLSPGALAMDSTGAMYVAEFGRIRKISPNGIVTPIAGNGLVGAAPGSLGIAANSGQTAIAVDSTGTVYYGTRSLMKIPPGGAPTAISLPVVQISGLAFDRAGNLYVSDWALNQVFRLTPAGGATVFAGTGQRGSAGDTQPAISAELSSPSGLAFDAAGNLYIADAGNARVRKVSTSGIITTVAGNGLFNMPVNGPALAVPISGVMFLAIDSSGSIFAANEGTVFKISNGTLTVYEQVALGSTGDGGLATNTNINIYGLTIDPSGNLYLSDPFITNRIHEVVAAPPTWALTPTGLNLQAYTGTPPAPQTIGVTGLAGMAYSVTTGTSNGKPWLRASVNAGLVPSTIQVTADPTGLAPGSYDGAVMILVPAALPPRAVNVHLIVNPAPLPQFTVLTRALSLTVPQGGSSVQTISIANPTQQPVSFTASAATSNGGTWLSVSPAESSIEASTLSSISVAVKATGLNTSVYSGTVTVATRGTSGQSQVPVTMTVLPDTPAIMPSQSGLSLTAIAGGGAPLPQTFGVLNAGSMPVTWTAAAHTSTGASNWLAVNASAGSSPPQPAAAAPVTVSVDPSGLSAGTYGGWVTLAAPGSLAATAVSVVVNVLHPGGIAHPVVSPSRLLFASTDGSNPAAQPVFISNLSGKAVSYESIGGADNSANWVQYSPAISMVGSQDSAEIVVQPSASGLSTGVYHGSVSLVFDDGSQQNVELVFVVGAVASTGAAACAPVQLNGLITSFASGVSVVPGQPATLRAAIVDNCGQPVTGGPVSIEFSTGDAPVLLNSLGNGYWEATWIPTSTAGTSIWLTLSAVSPILNSAALDTVNVQIGPAASASSPNVFAGGVGSAADSSPGAPVARGGLIAIYGSEFSDVSQRATAVPLPSQIAGTSVSLGDQPLPLLYLSPGQIDAVIPYDAPANFPLLLTVNRGGLISPGAAVVVSEARPAVFLQPQVSARQGAIVGPSALASPQTPVRSGDQIVIYCEGLGPVSPELSAGSLTPDSLFQTINPVYVTVGGQDANVEFAGLAPGAVAEYQINLTVPAGVTPGDSVPVVIKVAGQVSQAVTIGVR